LQPPVSLLAALLLPSFVSSCGAEQGSSTFKQREVSGTHLTHFTHPPLCSHTSHTLYYTLLTHFTHPSLTTYHTLHTPSTTLSSHTLHTLHSQLITHFTHPPLQSPHTLHTPSTIPSRSGTKNSASGFGSA
jgi:hypothetical protein